MSKKAEAKAIAADMATLKTLEAKASGPPPGAADAAADAAELCQAIAAKWEAAGHEGRAKAMAAQGLSYLEMAVALNLAQELDE